MAHQWASGRSTHEKHSPGHAHLANSCLQDGIKATLGGVQVAGDSLLVELLAEVVDVAGQGDDVLEREWGVGVVPGLTQPRRDGTRGLVWGGSQGMLGCKERKSRESFSREVVELSSSMASTEREKGRGQR